MFEDQNRKISELKERLEVERLRIMNDLEEVRSDLNRRLKNERNLWEEKIEEMKKKAEDEEKMKGEAEEKQKAEVEEKVRTEEEWRRREDMEEEIRKEEEEDKMRVMREKHEMRMGCAEKRIRNTEVECEKFRRDFEVECEKVRRGFKNVDSGVL